MSHPSTRRQFIATASAAAAAVASSRMVHSAIDPSRAAETTLQELYQSLTADQRGVVARAWKDPLRNRVNANWHITKPLIGSDFYTDAQRGLVERAVRQLTTESGYDRLKKQTEDDDGGINAYSMACFGKPGDERFEWMLTGRHLTLRADGNTQDKVAFGGPIVYGHGEESSPKENVFYFQTEKVQRVYDSLSSEQRKQALISGKPPAENSVDIQGSSGKFLGLAVSELKDEPRVLFEQALRTILSMYRNEDSSEAMDLIQQNGGLDQLRLAYFSHGDLLDDRVWDIWRIEGPSAVVHFRGAPHVHAYLHIAAPRGS